MRSLREVLRFFLITNLTTDGEVLHISKDINENTDSVITDPGDLITYFFYKKYEKYYI